jgi:hypothetical protein
MWGLGQHTLLGIVIGLFTWGLGQHTLLGIVVGLRVASGNTLHWILLLVYVGSLATHFIVVYWVVRSFGQHTLLGIIVRLLYGSSAMGLK